MRYKKCFLIAPSGNIILKNLSLAKERLKILGFNEIMYRKDILSKCLSYAGSHERRIQEINEAYSSDADVIFAVLGGQGAIHTIDKIDYDAIKNSKKIIVGLSDITIILNSIFKNTKTRCLHGPNIGKIENLNKKTVDFLNKAINKENYKILFKNEDILKKGVAKAKIMGGNIELLGRSLGTHFEIETDNCILFLEDYKMKSWRVFDILWQLKISGKFDKVKGIILGNFLECEENINDYLKEFFKDFTIPVIFNQEIGHSEPNITIPLGENCIIDTNNLKWSILFN